MNGYYWSSGCNYVSHYPLETSSQSTYISHQTSNDNFFGHPVEATPLSPGFPSTAAMKESMRWLIAGLVLVSLPGIAAWFDADAEEQPCGLYMAHSNVFGDLGVFTAKALEKGEKLGAHDIVVPLIEDDGPIFQDQTWSQLLGYVEWEGRAVRALIAGTGSAVNLHSKLHNVRPSLTNDPLQQSEGLHRSSDAGAGAISYQVMEYSVSDTIPAGGQIMLNNVISSKGVSAAEFRKMDRTVEKMDSLFGGIAKTQRNDFIQDMLSFLHSGLSHHVADTFPYTPVQFQRARHEGTSNAWIYNDTTVAVSWLQDNGVCLDNVQPGKSSVAQAGRGVRATRTVPKGNIVLPVPVMPVSRFSLFKSRGDDHQLLRNYCFGHYDSSMLLCPYGSSASYVNHAIEKNANVKLVWSTRLDSKHNEWSKLSVDDVLDKRAPGLVMEMVAIKDISAGDEIFLDYGQIWEEEWEHHAKSWRSPNVAQEYQSALQLNHDEDHKQLRTEEEQLDDPYPDNVFVALRYQNSRTAEVHQEKLEHGITTKSLRWQRTSAAAAGLTRPIIIHKRSRSVFGVDSYEVEVLNHPKTHYHGHPEYIHDKERIILTGVPREALFFVDAPHTSDHHLETAFRSEIQIPDDVFPQAWLDAVVFDEVMHDENYRESFTEEGEL